MRLLIQISSNKELADLSAKEYVQREISSKIILAYKLELLEDKRRYGMNPPPFEKTLLNRGGGYFCDFFFLLLFVFMR